MIKIELTPAQKEVISTICAIEVEALTELIEEGPTDESKLIMEQHEAPEDEWKEELIRMKESFASIVDLPETLFNLEEDDLYLFRHVLFNLEEAEDKDDNCVTVKYPRAVKNVWKKLFTAEEFKNIIGATLSN